MANQRGLSGAEEAGDERDGHFFDRHAMLLNRRWEWRDARDHALAEDRRPLSPRHQAVHGGRVARCAGEQVIDRSFAEIAVDVAPASRSGECNAAAAVAIGETLGFDDTKARRLTLPALRIGQRVMQPAAGARHGFAVFAGETGDADVQDRRDIAGFRCCPFAWSARSRLVHSKSPSMDGYRPRRYPDMRRADLHSVRPTISLRDAPSEMANVAGDGRFPGSRVIAGTTFPGERPSGFRCRLSAHSCGGSSRFASTPELSRVCPAPYSLLGPSEDRTPSAEDSIRRKRRQVNPLT